MLLVELSWQRQQRLPVCLVWAEPPLLLEGGNFLANSCFVIGRLTEEVGLKTWDNGNSIHHWGAESRPSRGTGETGFLAEHLALAKKHLV